jgi:hypothetical protein
MWSGIVSQLLVWLSGIGVIGWSFTTFFTKPWLEFRNLKGQVYQEIIYTGNIGGRVKDEVNYDDAAHDKARDSLRRLATKVLETKATAWFPLRWYLFVLGYDLVKAGSGLIGLSNSLTSNDGSRGDHRRSIQVSLRLPGDH